MTHTPTHEPASADHAADTSEMSSSSRVTTLSNTRHDDEDHVGKDPATRTAHARQINAQRAAHAAQALHLHTHVSGGHAATDNVEQALIELLTDLHHLCHTCDLELTPLLHTAALIYASEAQAA